ncbi:hypothetical protein Zm00014a_038578 [Zea mays]|uniref:Uncharacterized protein n=1 Tax=Zea mays TaxID=4577 RepID=A0A3L6E6B6_MAIZE|nr:hypothetical protein Zm00014a_038578 [Zea mays]
MRTGRWYNVRSNNMRTIVRDILMQRDDHAFCTSRDSKEGVHTTYDPIPVLVEDLLVTTKEVQQEQKIPEECGGYQPMMNQPQL